MPALSSLFWKGVNVRQCLVVKVHSFYTDAMQKVVNPSTIAILLAFWTSAVPLFLLISG